MPAYQTSALVSSIGGIGTNQTYGQCVFSIGGSYVFVALASDQLTGALIACDNYGRFTSVLNASGKAITSGFPYTNSWNNGNCICVTTIDGINYMFTRQVNSATVYRGTWDNTNKYYSNFTAFATFSSGPSGANYNSMARMNDTTIRLITQSCYIAEFNCRTGVVTQQPLSVGGTWSPSSYPFSNSFATLDGYICGASGSGSNWYSQTGTSGGVADYPYDSVGAIRDFHYIPMVVSSVDYSTNLQCMHPSNYYNITYYLPNTGAIYAYRNSGIYTSGSLPSDTFGYGPNTGLFTDTPNVGALQNFTVPNSGMYKIEAWGARGGNQTNNSYSGGKGAYMCGNFALNQGDILSLMVGKCGNGSANMESGGGGGTFVVKQNSSGSYTYNYSGTTFKFNPLIIAGGGGGVSVGSVQVDASIGTSGTYGGSGATGTIGTNGNGASGGYAPSGAGLLTNGGNGTWGGPPPNGGTAFINGGLGGASPSGSNYAAYGGYGGGGGTHGNNIGGGGAGGYSGGVGGASASYSGGGGGSYNTGTSQTNTAALGIAGGYVLITQIGTITSSTSNLGIYSTTLNATTTGFTTSWTQYFEYGTTTSYGTQLQCGAAIPSTFSYDVPGLTSNTLYNYRACLTDGTNIINGSNATFTTKTGLATLTTQTTDTITVNSALGHGTIVSFDQ